jgi:hypothetical protein
VGLTNLGSESETCVGIRVHLVGVSISFEKNFYRLPFTPPLSGSPYRSFTPSPRTHASRLLGVRLAARRRDRAVLAGCAPRTAGPTAALPPYARRPRASTTASISRRHPFVTSASAPIKTGPFSFPARHRPPHPAIATAAGAPPLPAVPFPTQAL